MAVVRSRFEALGTYVELVLAGLPGALGTAVRLLRAELADLDLACSRFRADSELMRVNAAAGRRVAVSPLLAGAIAVALRAAEQTDGDVDPTLAGALVAAGYDGDFAGLPEDGVPVTPRPPRLDAWRDVALDRAAGTVRIPAGVGLDLGATAKAFGADRAAALIAAATGAGVLVNLGGDIAVAGPVPAGGWPVRVTDRPVHADDGVNGQLVHIHGGGLATSSTVVRRWCRGGTGYHHILDPRTGLPAEPVWRTVSVTAASCVDANTASTAAIVRGRPALGWLTELGLPSRLVDAAGDAHYAAGWPPDHRPAARPPAPVADRPGSAVGPVAGVAAGPATGSVVGPAAGPAVWPAAGSFIGPVAGVAAGPAIGSVVGPVAGVAAGPAIGSVVGPVAGVAAGPASGPATGLIGDRAAGGHQRAGNDGAAVVVGRGVAGPGGGRRRAAAPARVRVAGRRGGGR
ncbi:MAG: FAD:protein transferase [Mycobacteriales bacterium]